MATNNVLVGLEIRHRDNCPLVDNHDPTNFEICYERVEQWEEVEIPEPPAKKSFDELVASASSFEELKQLVINNQ